MIETMSLREQIEEYRKVYDKFLNIKYACMDIIESSCEEVIRNAGYDPDDFNLNLPGRAFMEFPLESFVNSIEKRSVMQFQIAEASNNDEWVFLMLGIKSTPSENGGLTLNPQLYIAAKRDKMQYIKKENGWELQPYAADTLYG